MVGLVVNGLGIDIVVNREDGFRLDASFSVAPGETVALLGPNGAGKSTLVAVVAGLVAVDAGRVTLGGSVLDDADLGTFVPAEKRHVGVVFQDNRLFPHMSVLDNVAFGPLAAGVRRSDAEATARRWLDLLGVGALGTASPGDLSGGQAQRVAVARTLASEPEVLLFDEPLSALDIESRSLVRAVLSDVLGRFPGPRVVVTHDPVEAFLLGDRMVILEGGAVTHDGLPDEIRLRPRTRYAAEVAGVNLLAGHLRGGRFEVDGHVLEVIADADDGPARATIHPTAISLHAEEPQGSQRNTWLTSVDEIEDRGHRARVRVGHPLPLTVEVTSASVAELGLERGSQVWVAVKATEVGLHSGR